MRVVGTVKKMIFKVNDNERSAQSLSSVKLEAIASELQQTGYAVVGDLAVGFQWDS